MGFSTPVPPPVDMETFQSQPLSDRVRAVVLHWVDFGFGSPLLFHCIYIMKLAVLYIGLGVTLATLTSGLGAPWHVTQWWNEPIVYQKLVLWTLLLETIGVAGSWGPLAGKFKPMTGGYLFWLRPGTIRMPPWPGKVPGTNGFNRTKVDVVLYALLLVATFVPIILPGSPGAQVTVNYPEGFGNLVSPVMMIAPLVLLALVGLRDKVIFIAARAEQYGPAVLMFTLAPVLAGGFVDMIIMLKLLIFSVWVGAGVSKFGKHFSFVIPPMISNAPIIPSKLIKRIHYRNFPEDVRPGGLGVAVGHGLGTLVEIATPIVLLFTTNFTVALVAAGLMICFHLFITATFPLAVPLEWNLLFAYTAGFLFLGFPNADGYSIYDASSPWLVIVSLAGLFFFPVLGNLRPDLVAFTPSMRQYAGNWASALWGFQPGAEDKLEAITRPTKNQVNQLQQMGFPQEAAELTVQQTLGWRSMHSQGRGLLSLMYKHVKDVDRATIREAEFACNSLVGFNFGDGHLHNHHLIAVLQRRCHFEPGEFIVAFVESQPIHKNTQTYMVIDAAVGIVERGTWKVADAVAEQPWLPNGPIPVNVTWRNPNYTPASEVARQVVTEQVPETQVTDLNR
ncbi:MULTISPECIES: DUF3556 domain-containing protein [unclassified Brevibacterium]|jgi:hypothetical protein|uniref:DUF3556 domain-containing protein n=1 Tax=unclassified Brevibacterium TaxID=2614124 RepID=UPI00109269E4|nr:DUF3556 domain-containing protein [Brevibacterium sp. S22]TGD30169.1 DUF3556 domain-containing protein [Brevibacterium sp. S22]